MVHWVVGKGYLLKIAIIQLRLVYSQLLFTSHSPLLYIFAANRTTMAKRRPKFYQKLRSKYRLVIMRDTTFEEVWFMRLSRMNVIAAIALSLLVVTTLVVLLIVFTPVKELIPGYPSPEVTRDIRMNALKLDSLEYQVFLKDQFIENLLTIVDGGEPKDHSTGPVEVPIQTSNIQDIRSAEDSLLREEVEAAQRFNVRDYASSQVPASLNQIYFFPPVKGLIFSSFNRANGHYGVDVAATSGQSVMAVLDGTVTLADYTSSTGYTLQIQHDHDLISIYKHNNQLFKRPGDRVRAGEVIATIGNTGELTTGPHLHFELWHRGRPLDPQHFISFE